MSLLEDVFLQDEADEAQDLERVIEGDEYEEIRRQNSSDDDDDGGAGRDDEAEEDRRRVDPNTTKVKKVVKNPRFVLNPARLTGPRGIHVIPEHFKDFKFKGKGREKEDLDLVLKKLEHWAYRLYPKFKFADCLKKMETLGKKRPVMVNLHKIRSDQFVNDEDAVIQKDSSDDEQPPPEQEDEFDKLLQQQIELARNTPARATPVRPQGFKGDISTPFAMPKATSSPSISDEQKQRMIENRKKAEQRRLARLQQITENSENIRPNDDKINDSVENNTEEVINVEKGGKKQKKSNVIDSSDEEDNKSNEKVKIDLTETVNVKTNNRSHIIDSSDDENDMTDKNVKKDNDKETKNVEMDLTGTRNVKKNNRSQMIESSDEEIDPKDSNDKNEKEPVEIDLTEERYVTKKVTSSLNDVEMSTSDKSGVKNAEIDLTKEQNVPNVIRRDDDSDSSDDECNVTAENVSITVDIHKTNSDVGKKNVGVTSKSDKIEDFDAILSQHEEEIKESSIEKVSDDTDKEINKENGKSVVFEDKTNEDMMDVDFSEAF